jgi:hypothetical protein
VGVSWESAGNRLGVRWESGGNQLGGRWEANWRPMGGQWEAAGSLLGVCWESAGSPSLAQLIPVIAMGFSDGDFSYFLWEFLCHITCK